MTRAHPDDQAEMEALKSALVDDLEALATALLGEPNRGLSSKAEWRWGSKGARSLQIRSVGRKRRGDWFDHSANDGGGPLHMIRDARGQGWADAFTFARGWAGLDGTKPQDRAKLRQPDPAKVAAQEAEAATERARRIAYARDLWGQRQSIAGTAAHAYLASRAIASAPDLLQAGIGPNLPECIAFLPGEHRGLIVAATDDVGNVQAVQIVHLDDTGRKMKAPPPGWREGRIWAQKQTFGVPDGAPVRLPAAPVWQYDDAPLLLAEGPETGLSVWRATGCETWVALGSLSKIKPPAGRAIVVCRDDDKRFSPADRRMTATLKAWREARHDMRVAMPWPTRREDKSDMNDVLQESGPEAVRAAINRALHPSSSDGRRRFTRPEAHRVLDAATSAFFAAADRHDAEQGEPPVHAIKVDVGGGKSFFARQGAVRFLAKRRAEGDDKATVAILVPTQKLANEQAIDVESLPAARAAGLVAAVWKGREQPDPDAPGETMCRNMEAINDALAAGVSDVEKAACKGVGADGEAVACPFFSVCGYQRQRQRRADVWIAPHEMLYQAKPAALGEISAAVVDESAWQDGLEGTQGRPVLLSLDSLNADADIEGNAFASQRLRTLRGMVADAIGALQDGPLPRDVIEATGLTAESAQEARSLEWRRKVEPKMHPGMTQAERRAEVKAAEGNTTIRRLAMFWRGVEALLSDGGPQASGWVELATERDDKGAVRVLRLKGRKLVREGWQVPTLAIDATLDVDLLRPFWPQVQLVADVGIEAPHQHIAQAVDVSFSLRRLLAWEGAPKAKRQTAAKNLRNLHAVAFAFARSHAPRPVLVVAQKGVEEALPAHGPLPPNVILAHHNAIAGRDEWTTATGETIKGADLAGLLVVGRTLPGPHDVERTAEALTGVSVGRLPGWYPRVTVTREMANGDHIEAEADRHPDPMAEAARWQAAEAELIQIIGRGRGVNRDAENPLDVLVLTDVPLPMPVDRTLTLADLTPSPRDLMLAAGGIAYDNPTDASTAYPALWATRDRAKDAFKYAGNEGGWGESGISKILIRESPQPLPDVPSGLNKISYQPVGMGKRRVVAWYVPALVPDPVAALVDAVGPLAWHDVELDFASEPPPGVAVAVDTVQAAQVPIVPPLSGLFTVRGPEWEATIATDPGALVTLWRPLTGENSDIPVSAVLPMWLAPMPQYKPPRRIEPEPDLPPLPEPFAGWGVEPRKPNVLSRMTT